LIRERGKDAVDELSRPTDVEKRFIVSVGDVPSGTTGENVEMPQPLWHLLKRIAQLKKQGALDCPK
jgi:hypothetical protein